MRYYNVKIGVKKFWKDSEFTYSHTTTTLKIGAVVRVQFGKQKKVGVVISTTTKPTFAVKEIEYIYPFSLSPKTSAFMNWFQAYYQAESSEVFQLFLPGYLSARPKPIDPEPSTLYDDAPSLTETQQVALDTIKAHKTTTILHGVTGAGKTRIYTHLLIEQIKNGKNALLLYPEISLTTQVVNELRKYAPIIVFHSQLNQSERSNLWYKVALSTTPHIIVGPRSAVFLPHKNLGIIIVDEMHESAYKQENDIRYNALYAAAGLARSHSSKLLYGSATPPVAETKLILDTGGSLVCIHTQAITHTAEKVTHVIDAKNRALFSKHPLVSNTLLQEIEFALQRKKQALLFLNRRGTAKRVLCSSDSCEWTAECTRCDLPLTFHHDSYSLVCHTCGNVTAMPQICPVCSSPTLLKTLGSKAIVEDIQKLFPHARIGRYDSDTDKEKSFVANYDAIRDGSVDILIGTQQLVKGVDLPKLSLIGILNADLSLHFPDYTSDERTFQLIAQAMGRVARGHTSGTIVLQTFQPTNTTISLATTEDWHTFFELEVHNRQEHAFPPYEFYGKILFRHKQERKSEELADAYKKKIGSNKTISIDGPMPSFTYKRAQYYYTQLILHAASRSAIISVLKKHPTDGIIDLDPATLL